MNKTEEKLHLSWVAVAQMNRATQKTDKTERKKTKCKT